jgi:hypothetical protein
MQFLRFSMITFSLPSYSDSIFLISLSFWSLMSRSLVIATTTYFGAAYFYSSGGWLFGAGACFLAKANFFFGKATSFSLFIASLRLSRLA